MKKNKICIMILTGIYIFFISIFNVKAEVLGTGIYGLNYNDDNGVHWQTSCSVLDMSGNTGIGHCTLNNMNLYGNGNAKLYITNGGTLSNKSVSFVVYNGNNNIDVTGIFLEDNNTTFSCEIYSSLYNQNTMAYNVICPNLPTLTGNATNINFMIVNQTFETFVVNLDFGISAINGFDSNTTSINDIKNSINEDVDNNYKQAPNQSDYNNYHQKENNIIGQISNTDTSAINIQNNNNANLFIWNTMTRCLESHAKVMALMISILSIGIIKLILNR